MNGTRSYGRNQGTKLTLLAAVSSQRHGNGGRDARGVRPLPAESPRSHRTAGPTQKGRVRPGRRFRPRRLFLRQVNRAEFQRLPIQT